MSAAIIRFLHSGLCSNHWKKLWYQVPRTTKPSQAMPNWTVEKPRGQWREDSHCPRPHVALLYSRTTGVLRPYYLQDRTLRFSGLTAASPYTRSVVSPAAGGGSSLYKTALSSTLYKTALSSTLYKTALSTRQLSLLHSKRQLSLLYYPLQDSSIFSLLLSIRHL